MLVGGSKLTQFGLLRQVVRLLRHMVDHIIPRHNERLDLVPGGGDFNGFLALGVVQQPFVDLVAISLAHEEGVKHSLRAVLDISGFWVPRFYFEGHWPRRGRLLDLATVIERSLLILDDGRDGSIQFTFETIGGGPDILLDIENLRDRKG